MEQSTALSSSAESIKNVFPEMFFFHLRGIYYKKLSVTNLEAASKKFLQTSNKVQCV